MKPEPSPRSGPGLGAGTPNCRKNWENGSSPSNGVCAGAGAGLDTVMFTTAGPACSASRVKSGSPARPGAARSVTEVVVVVDAIGVAEDAEQPATKAGNRAARTATRSAFAFMLGSLAR